MYYLFQHIRKFKIYIYTLFRPKISISYDPYVFASRWKFFTSSVRTSLFAFRSNPCDAFTRTYMRHFEFTSSLHPPDAYVGTRLLPIIFQPTRPSIFIHLPNMLRYRAELMLLIVTLYKSCYYLPGNNEIIRSFVPFLCSQPEID